MWYSASAWCGLKGQRQINPPAQCLDGNDWTVRLSRNSVPLSMILWLLGASSPGTHASETACQEHRSELSKKGRENQQDSDALSSEALLSYLLNQLAKQNPT